MYIIFKFSYLELLPEHRLEAEHHHHHWLMTFYLGFHLSFVSLFGLAGHEDFSYM